MTPTRSFRRAVCPALLALAGALCLGPARAAAQDSTRGDLVVRTRLIGIFDAQTGAPIDSAEVKDVFTGLSALTTATGTVVLPLDTAGAFLRVRKIGYNMNTFMVPNSVADSMPVTLVLEPVSRTLPAMVSSTKGVVRGPADTSLKLEVSGFYNRRQLGEAPASAYVSQAQIARWRPTLLTDLAARTGRPWMFQCTIYIDGVLTNVPPTNLGPGRPARNLTAGIDQLLDPTVVAGVEVYRASEVPPEYNATVVGAGALSSGASTAGCVTLIWTR
ncbi:MAG TPA: hypothetical protein VFT41_12310 [Gemmatimonadaceae bacterium]|nr:hypothetical protein [Gemmatimonadaceae bacterium]